MSPSVSSAQQALGEHSVRKERPRPSRSRARRLQAALTRLVKSGVVQADAKLIAENGGYSATADKDGIIWLPTGDALNAVDEVGKGVSGEPRCDGLSFWLAGTDAGRSPITSGGQRSSASRR